jgi:Protein of unknown function (DUF3631)
MSALATDHCSRCGGDLCFDPAGDIVGCSSGCALFLIRNGNGDRPHTVTAAALAAIDSSCAPAEATPAPDLPALNEVLDELIGFFRRFVAMTEEEADAAGLWIVHTHTLEAANATPYLSATSAEKESGKTRFLEVSELLVARPWLTGRTTAAVLPRKIDAERPTLLLDESDAAFKGDREYAEALRGVLNSGHRRGGKTTVCVGQGAEIGFKDFSTFCPKAIAGIGKLPDTVQSRSIPIRLKRRAPGERIERFRYEDAKVEARPLREALERVAAVMVLQLKQARPDLPDELGDRAQDCWEPLLAVADLAGEDWPDRARRAAVTLSGTRSAEDDSAGVLLLSHLRTVFVGRDTDRLSTEILLDALRGLDESPWSDWCGKPLTARGLARLLKPYAIGPHSDGTTRGYKRESFEDAWGRYLPSQVSKRQEAALQSQKPAISVRQPDRAADTLEWPANPLPKRNSDALTLESGGEA